MISEFLIVSFPSQSLHGDDEWEHEFTAFTEFQDSCNINSLEYQTWLDSLDIVAESPPSNQSIRIGSFHCDVDTPEISASQDVWECFREISNQPSLLYFNNKIGDKLNDLLDRNDQSVFKLNREDGTSLSIGPASVFSEFSTVSNISSRHLFESTTDAADSGMVIRSKTTPTASSDSDCFARPYVLRFRLNGSQVDTNFKRRIKDAKNLLARLLDQQALKSIQPLFSSDSDLEWVFLKEWNECTQAIEKRSVIEKLFHSEDQQISWYPFFVLDQLGGTFTIDGFGTSTVKFSWIPNQDYTSHKNYMWLAEYWAERWIGEIGEPSNYHVIPPPKTLNHPNLYREVGDYEDVYKLLASECNEGSLDVLTLLGKVYREARVLGAEHDPYVHRRFINNGKLSLQCFVEEVSERILPASQILVKIPELTSECFSENQIPKYLEQQVGSENEQISGLYLDIVKSRGSSWHFLLDVCKRRENILPKTPVDGGRFDYSAASWWLGFFPELISLAPHDFRLQMEVRNHGFVLNASSLDREILGMSGSPNPRPYTREEVRFYH